MWVVKWALLGLPGEEQGGGCHRGLWEALGGPLKTTCKLKERVLWCSVKAQGGRETAGVNLCEWQKAKGRRVQVGMSIGKLNKGRSGLVEVPRAEGRRAQHGAQKGQGST